MCIACFDCWRGTHEGHKEIAPLKERALTLGYALRYRDLDDNETEEYMKLCKDIPEAEYQITKRCRGY